MVAQRTANKLKMASSGPLSKISQHNTSNSAS